MQPTLRYPGFWLALGLVVLAVVSQAVVATPFHLLELALNRPHNFLQDPIVLGFINLVSFSLPIGLGLWVNRLPPRRAFPLIGISPLAWIALPMIVFGGGVVLSELDNVFRWAVPIPRYLADMMSDLFFSSDDVLSQFFLLSIVAPITEEFLFRGVILRGLLGRFNPWKSVLLTSMLFAAMHLNPWQLLTALMLGLMTGWFYLRTASLWPCIAAHALHNSVVVVLGVAPFGWWEPPTAEDLMNVEFQPWWLDLAGLAVLMAGVMLFLRATRASAIKINSSKPPLLKANEIPPVLPA